MKESQEVNWQRLAVNGKAFQHRFWLAECYVPIAKTRLSLLVYQHSGTTQDYLPLQLPRAFTPWLPC